MPEKVLSNLIYKRKKIVFYASRNSIYPNKSTQRKQGRKDHLINHCLPFLFAITKYIPMTHSLGFVLLTNNLYFVGNKAKKRISKRR